MKPSCGPDRTGQGRLVAVAVVSSSETILPLQLNTATKKSPVAQFG